MGRLFMWTEHFLEHKWSGTLYSGHSVFCASLFHWILGSVCLIFRFTFEMIQTKETATYVQNQRSAGHVF